MLKRLLFTLLILYTLLIGANFVGIVEPTLRLIGVALVGVVLVLWLWSRRHWRWHRTALDGVMLVWAAAFAISLAANSGDWRRIGIGLWFVGLYAGVWYLLQDTFANRGLRREWLVDPLLIAGAITTLVGYMQVENALLQHQEIPRPVGVLGNPNFLAALLVMLLPMIAGRLRMARTPLARVLLAVDGAATLGMIGLTFSRGGWIAAVVALGLWAVMSLPLLRWWKATPLAVRALIVLVIVGGLAFGARVLVQSLGIGGRGLEVRSWIYETAIREFTDHPLTGTGLFTMGAGLAQYNSMPPFEPHSHAHNIILNVAAELGIVGLLALALTAWATLRGALRAKDPLAIMGIAAFAGAVVHQMFDMPMMKPALALTAVAALVLALPATTPTLRRRWQPALIAVGGAVLVITGLWSALNYSAYYTALRDGLASGDYRAAAARLQAVEASDPMMPIYPEQRGELLGLAASMGDAQAAQDGAASMARAVALAPSYATNWANLAALQEQSGDLRGAADSMAQASALADESWSLLYRAASYAETAGNLDDAKAKYLKLIGMDSGVLLLPDWNDSPVRRAIAVSDDQRSLVSRVIPLLEQGDVAAAQSLWDANPALYTGLPDDLIVRLMIALTRGDRPGAQVALQYARNATLYPRHRAWDHLGAALLDASRFDAEIAAARAEVYVPLTGHDWEFGVNIPYLQYLHLAIPRQFLPQVGYTENDPLLVHLLEDSKALPEIQAALRQP